MQVLLDQISRFDQSLKVAVERFRQKLDMPTYLKGIAEGATQLADEIVALGDYAQKRLEEDPQYDFYRINYAWADEAKAFLILWRDVQLEQEKAQVLLWDGKTTEEHIAKLKEASCRSIAKAGEELIKALEGEGEGGIEAEKRQLKQIEQWKHQHNPWPTYREQILQLPAQCKDIQEQFSILQNVSEAFRQIRIELTGLIAKSEGENIDFVKKSEETIELIGDCMPDGGTLRPGRIAAKLEDIQELLVLPNYLEELNRNIEGLLEGMPEKVRVPFAAEEGMIQYKDLSFRRTASQWLEAKIMPVVFEVWEIAERERNSFKTTLLNIRNRTSLLSAELKEGKQIQATKEDVCQPVEMFLANAGKWEEEIGAQRETIERRLERDFVLSTIYESDIDFLALPFQSTIRYFTPSQNEFRQQASKGLSRIRNLIQRIRQQVTEEESLSTPEKLVRFIQGRRPDESHSNYTSIFLTKGYIGESFWVGREKELEHIEQLINNWDRGVRGAVILYGQRLAGKSLFGELVANRFFYKRTIRLQPMSVIKLEGRQMTTSHNLGEALEFIRKYSLSIRPLVWIDDLELWRNPQIPLSQNIRSLQQHLDHHADDQFFMLGMNTWLKDHIDKEHDFEQVVHSALRLDKMNLNEVQEAIWIRHSATNKQLVDEAGTEIDPARFKKMVNSLHKASKGNIGESLNRWAFSIRWKDDDHVLFEAPVRNNMPDFLTPDVILLLNTFMVMKRTNEYQLRKIFGPAFKTKYRNLLNQLISLGLVQRQVDGMLEINELVVNDLSRMMETKAEFSLS